MEIALSYLKKRFNEYSLDEVMFSLIDYLENNEEEEVIPEPTYSRQPLEFRDQLPFT